jgi:hypothetical protein
MTVRLRRDGDGGYQTADGRFTVRPVTMGEGTNNNRGWSPGHREWLLTDTTGRAVLHPVTGATRVMTRLYDVRDVIAAATTPTPSTTTERTDP